MSDVLYLRNDQLAQCEQLKERGFPQTIQTGSHLSRGFADLGYEQFILLPSGTLLSLFTGDTSRLAEEHRNFFFCIPTIDTMAVFLEDAGYLVESKFTSDGEWCLVAQSPGDRFEFVSRQLWQALLECCLRIPVGDETA